MWADTIKARCTECRLKEKKCMGQKMGPLPDHRVQVGAVFQSVAIDLFGPVEFQQHVKKRQVGKGGGGGLCVYHNIRATRGVHGHVLHG